MKKKIHLNLNYALIQNIRLIHALMESKYLIVLSEKDSLKFQELKRIFNVEYEIDFTDSTEVTNYSISHEKPSTSIGSISRALIFPSAITRHCKNIWQKEREVLCSFAGLMTQSRKDALNKYIKNNSKTENSQLITLDTRFQKFILKMKRYLFRDSEINQKKINDILFWSSTRGRSFPIKAWDEDYFELLSKSKFVLCPNGDFIWTYRFFEATLCGAIPIIEDYCDLYEGFRFKTFDDDLHKLIWSKEDAEFNYSLCVERLTISSERLNKEIDLIFKG